MDGAGEIKLSEYEAGLKDRARTPSDNTIYLLRLLLEKSRAAAFQMPAQVNNGTPTDKSDTRMLSVALLDADFQPTAKIPGSMTEGIWTPREEEAIEFCECIGGYAIRGYVMCYSGLLVPKHFVAEKPIATASPGSPLVLV